MNIDILFQALSDDEKERLLQLISNWKFPDKSKERKLTPIEEWVGLQTEISVRLKNVLLKGYQDSSGQLRFKFVELILKKDFFHRRNAGKKSWQEFVRLRGF